MDINHKPRARTDAALAAFALALFATAAGAASCGDMLLVARRGDPDRPENSASAIEAALQGSWDGAAIDVQQLQSGEWALNADPSLGRSTSVSARATRDMNATAWRAVHLRDRAGRLTDEPAAFLEAALDSARQHPDKVLDVNLAQPFAGCQASQGLSATLASALPSGQ